MVQHMSPGAPTLTVLRRLGRGGMGVVDLAVDAGGNEVALKRLALHGTAAEMHRARARLRREAEVLRSLDHPSIVALLDVFDDGDDVVLVMPYMTGGSLAERVARGGPMAPGDVGALADHLLGALAEAQRHGVVHRDITPSNVLFDVASRPFLADFGVARRPGATAGLTAAGLVVGTPGFMAPEQAQGLVATAASDVFSLGATLVWAATARSVYGTGDPDVLHHRAVRGQVERLDRSVPAELRRRLEPLVEPRPRRRPSAAGALGRGPGGTSFRRARPRRPRLGRTARRRLGTARVAGATAAALAGLGVVVGLGSPAWLALGGGEGPVEPSPEAADAGPAAPGTPAAPRCAPATADYDGDPGNGCEAVGDEVDGSPLEDRLAANLVPAGDVDRYLAEVDDRPQLMCDGSLTLTLTAPAGLTQRLEVFGGTELLGQTTSADGEARQVRLREPNCGDDDATTLELVVTSVGSDRSDEAYLLERSGSF